MQNYKENSFVQGFFGINLKNVFSKFRNEFYGICEERAGQRKFSYFAFPVHYV